MSSVASDPTAPPEVPAPGVGALAAQRRDVQRNREALLRAARELFATRSDVPMYEVARRAGVGQATLYRHFPDRGSLVAAVAEETLVALEKEARALPAGGGAFSAVLKLAAASLARSGAFIELLQAEEKAQGLPAPGSLLHRVMERFLSIVEGPLQQAKAAGVLAADFGQEDLVVVLAMLKGALECAGPSAEERAQVAERALGLLLRGVLEAPGSKGPPAGAPGAGS